MHTSFGITESDYNLLQETFRRLPLVEKVMVFGSRAKGTHQPKDDLDLAIYGPHLDEIEFFEVAAHLNQKLSISYRIDVVAPEIMDDPGLAAHVEEHGKLFFNR